MRENLSLEFQTRSDTNQAVQPSKMAIGLKFWISKEEGFYYLYSEIKGADQMHSYCAADLRLCFLICKSRFSHDVAQIETEPETFLVCSWLIFLTSLYGIPCDRLVSENSFTCNSYGR